jgi:Ubiquitin-activating enzyme E1 FCCH domain
MYINKATLISSNIQVDDGGSDIRITAANHGLTTGDTVFIDGVGGTTEANGTFVVTRISDSQFTLDGTTYVNTWTGGGAAYTGWRLRLSFPDANNDCHVTLSFQRILSGSIASVETIAFIVSTTTQVLLTADPVYDFAVVWLNILSTEASAVIKPTIQLLDKDNTVYKGTYVEIAAGGRWSHTNSGQSYKFDATGGMFFSAPPP